MRENIWHWLLQAVKHEPHTILPRWLVAVRWLLFPLQMLIWWVGDRHGYQPMRDEWVICGVRYSACSLRLLSKADGALLRVIAKDGDSVTIERVPNAK